MANPLSVAFTAHPRSVDETYTEHMAVAAGFGGSMILAGLACLVHAVFPFLFVKTGSAAITRLHDRMVTHRRRTAPIGATIARQSANIGR